MTLIDVPGDDLMRVHDLLQKTYDMINGASIGSMGHVTSELGQSSLEDAAGDFESKWKDGRYVVGRDLGTVRDAAKSIVDSFQKTDDQTIHTLTDQKSQS